MVKSTLEANSVIMLKLFQENDMVPTPGKCNCLLIGNHEEPNKKKSKWNRDRKYQKRESPWCVH